MSTNEIDAPRKTRTTVYMSEGEETLLNELFIKRLREKRKTRVNKTHNVRLDYDGDIGV